MTQAGWNDDLSAQMYDAYTFRFPTYQEGSRRLVVRAGIGKGDRVLDLACGTGITTAEVLTVVGSTGSVTAVDVSRAMLSVARRRIDDDRVLWVESPAEDLANPVEGNFDVILCHGAIWQMDIVGVAREVRRLLAPGGRFVCNAPAVGSETAARERPGLYELMRAYAVIDHGFVFQPGRERRPVSAAAICDALRASGLQVECDEVDAPLQDHDAFYRWMQVPVFTEHWTGLTYEQRMDALTKAWARFDDQTTPRRAAREIIIIAR